MNTITRRTAGTLTAAIVALGTFWPVSSAWAVFPDKPIRLVIGFPPGTATDVATRIITKKMSEELGRPIVVDNKPGVGTNIAGQAVARSPAGTPEPVINVLAKALDKATDSAEVKEQLSNQGIEPFKGNAKAFAEHMNQETKKWTERQAAEYRQNIKGT